MRKIPLKERPAFNEDGSPLPHDEDGTEDPAVSDALNRIRNLVFKDRTLYDKVCLCVRALVVQDVTLYAQAAKAFVSFVRAYSKHEASYIFRIKDLDLVGVAKSFGLLRLPRMPELKDVNRDGWQDADVDVSCFPHLLSFALADNAHAVGLVRLHRCSQGS